MYAEAQNVDHQPSIHRRRESNVTDDDQQQQQQPSHDEAPHCLTCLCLNALPEHRPAYELQQQQQQQQQQSCRPRCMLQQQRRAYQAEEERLIKSRRRGLGTRSSMAVDELLREMNLGPITRSDEDAVYEPDVRSRIEEPTDKTSCCTSSGVRRRNRRARPNHPASAGGSNCHSSIRRNTCRTAAAATALVENPSLSHRSGLISNRSSGERRPASSHCLRERINTGRGDEAINSLEAAAGRHVKSSMESTESYWTIPLSKWQETAGKCAALLGAGDDSSVAEQRDTGRTEDYDDDDDDADDDALIAEAKKATARARSCTTTHEHDNNNNNNNNNEEDNRLLLTTKRNLDFLDEITESRPATDGETELELARWRLVERVYEEARELRRLQRRLDGRGSPTRTAATMTSAGFNQSDSID